MIHIQDKQDCCGCTACQSICAHQAITLQPDELGFLYPVVNKELCVGCLLCDKVCPLQHQEEDRHFPLSVFAARHRDKAELGRSRSGAAFWALAQAFINEGIIYGACFDSPTHIVHRRATTLEECQSFRGSKYAQSDLTRVFDEVKCDLSAGRQVMFTGTPCQIAGLKRFIPASLAERLVTVDLVCHGTASPRVWSENIRYIEQKYGSQVVSADFRNKRYGWRRTIETYHLANRQEKKSSLFSNLFDQELTERDSCGCCPYTNLQRVGDLTIGDFWKWYKYSDEWTDDQGINVVMVNSNKGQALFDKVQAYLSCRPSDREACLQPQLEHPLTFNANRGQFIHDFASSGYEYALSKQSLTGWKAQLRGIKITVIGKIVEAKNWLIKKVIKKRVRCV